MCAGALVSLSYYLPAFLFYAYFSVLPLACGFLLAGGTLFVAMGCMALVFAAAVTFAAHHFNRSFVRGLRLNLDLSERTDELTRRTEQLVAVNTQLQAEIAQREDAENRLHQAQKMEALGHLTGGIAHDFNNLLTAVTGNLELVQKRASGDPTVARPLSAALSAAERGATLIQDLLIFARRKTLLPTAVNISAVVDDAEKILKQTIGPHIRLLIHTTPDLKLAWVDPNQLGLAIVNLALNARDAMPGGGTLQIACENRQVEISGPTTDLSAGDYVTVSVSDTGTGMSEATLARAFEPFFTTKPPGRGSGMGLSMVQGFAAQSGGAVRITTSLGKGSTVELWLPPAKVGAVPTASAQQADCVMEHRRARILVCDDDGDVRSVVGSLLRELGHTVWEASDPLLALQILQRERPVDLLLVDYAMPAMNGQIVIDRARTFQPDLKTLLMTGYVEALRQNAISGTAILPKPFKAAELSKVIGEILTEFPYSDRERSSSLH
jgi:signal transduction histidine kinase/ActR/RegA family two-component response regulator